MLGSDTPLALQHSVQANSLVERCLQETMQQLDIPYRTGAFRSIIGNDEIVWEAHDISMPSLSRFPYPEYHTSDDNPDIISREHLTETVDLLDELVRHIEEQKIIKKKFRGVPCTSNPEYDLYIDTFYEQYISSNGVSDKEKIELRATMDYLPIMDTYHTVSSLLSRFNIGRKRALDYLRRWEEKELIEII
jgi:aminopeptidase-like protein